jgi:hypothetical protein
MSDARRDQMLQQRSLPDPSLTPQNQRPTLTPRDARQQPVQAAPWRKRLRPELQ